MIIFILPRLFQFLNILSKVYNILVILAIFQDLEKQKSYIYLLVKVPILPATGYQVVAAPNPIPQCPVLLF